MKARQWRPEIWSVDRAIPEFRELLKRMLHNVHRQAANTSTNLRQHHQSQIRVLKVHRFPGLVDRRFGNAEIYILLSADSGRTWQPEERVSFTREESSTPHVAFTPGLLQLIWLEQHGGAYDVIYSRRTVAN